MTLAAEDTVYIRDVVERRTGNVIGPRQEYLMEARLKPVANSVGLDDVHSLVEELKRRRDPHLCQTVVEALAINETSFFRDRDPFDALQQHVLPELMHKRRMTRALSIWSAACSSGQEPYSIALLIRTAFAALNGWNVRVLATDMCETMVARTDMGIYSQFEVGRGLPATMLVANFERLGLNWQVLPYVRNLIEAQKRNLIERWPASEKHDVIFLRNVLVYFDRPTKEKVLRRIHQVLRPDGYLFLGGGETMLQLNVPFQPVALGRAVCFRPVPTQESKLC